MWDMKSGSRDKERRVRRTKEREKYKKQEKLTI